VTRVRARNAPEHVLPDGIALLPDGDVLSADPSLGGGVWVVSNRILRIGAIQVPVRSAEPVQWRD